MISRDLLNHPEQFAVKLSQMERDIETLKRELERIKREVQNGQ